MIHLDIRLEGDDSFDDVEATEMAGLGKLYRVALLKRGMTSGRPSVCVGIRFKDGDQVKVVLGQTSARNFVMAARAFEARYPDVMEGD